MVSRSAVLFRGQEVAYRWEEVGDKRAADSPSELEHYRDVFDHYRKSQIAQMNT